MEWYEITFNLLEDPMIQSCGCDGLLDAYNTLRGLSGMSELMHNSDKFNDEFILEAINLSIDARNRYTWMNGADKIPHVKLKNGEFEWEEEI